MEIRNLGNEPHEPGGKEDELGKDVRAHKQQPSDGAKATNFRRRAGENLLQAHKQEPSEGASAKQTQSIMSRLRFRTSPRNET